MMEMTEANKQHFDNAPETYMMTQYSFDNAVLRDTGKILDPGFNVFHKRVPVTFKFFRSLVDPFNWIRLELPPDEILFITHRMSDRKGSLYDSYHFVTFEITPIRYAPLQLPVYEPSFTVFLTNWDSDIFSSKITNPIKVLVGGVNHKDFVSNGMGNYGYRNNCIWISYNYSYSHSYGNVPPHFHRQSKIY